MMKEITIFGKSIDAYLSDVYRVCVNEGSVESLMTQILRPLRGWLDVDAMTLALVDAPSVLVASQNPLTDSFQARIKGHTARCLEGKSKAICNPEDIIVQQVGAVSEIEPIGEETNILWTGALESQGRMLAIATFYRQQAGAISPMELTALRQIRSLVCDALLRIIDGPRMEVGRRSDNIDYGLKADIAVIEIQDARLISATFGRQRLRSIQDAVVARIAQSRPHAFMIVRVTLDRIIVIEHEGHGTSFGGWRAQIEAIGQDVEIGGGINVSLTVEIGEVESISQQVAPRVPAEAESVQQPPSSSAAALAG
jgi:hypothetical protein